MHVAAVVEGVEAELRAQADPVRAEHEKRYLKSDFTHLGVPVPVLRKVATATVRSRPTRGELLELAGALWTATDRDRGAPPGLPAAADARPAQRRA